MNAHPVCDCLLCRRNTPAEEEARQANAAAQEEQNREENKGDEENKGEGKKLRFLSILPFPASAPCLRVGCARNPDIREE